jgi:hypothetical protein
LTRPADVDEGDDVRTGRSLVLMALLAVQTIGAFGGGTVRPPDPVGEKVYYAGLLKRTAPIAIIAGGLSLAWVLNKVRRKNKAFVPANDAARGT